MLGWNQKMLPYVERIPADASTSSPLSQCPCMLLYHGHLTTAVHDFNQELISFTLNTTLNIQGHGNSTEELQSRMAFYF